MNEKPAHLKIAEEVLKKVSTATRKRLDLTVKGSYTIVEDESGWIARITPKVAEFSKKAIDPKALSKAGLTEIGKDEFHRLHRAGIATAPASKDGEAEEVKEPTGPGVDELAEAVTVATKGRKSTAAAAKTKS